MSRSLLWILLFAVVPAPLFAQSAGPHPTSTLAGEIWTRSSTLRSPDVRLSNPMLAVHTDSFLQVLPLQSEMVEARRPRDRWCGAGWGAGLGGFAGFAYGLASTLWDDSLAPLAWMVVLPPVTGAVGAIVGAVIGC